MMRIDEMEIEADKSRLFNDGWLTWGEMHLESRRRDNSTDTFVQYYTKFLNSDDDDAVAEFEKFLEEDWPELRENPGTVRGNVHPTFLYVVEDLNIQFDEMRHYEPNG